MRIRTLQLLRLEDRWTPSGVPTSWNIRGSGGGGALFSPQINPADSNEYYIASDMSEVFHSANAGASWSMVDFRKLQGGHESRVQFTNDPNIRYALDYTGDSPTPTKSTNAGATWTPLANDPTGGGAVYLYADPGNASRLVVSDYSTLYYSSDGGNTWAQKFTTASGAGLLLGGAFWDGTSMYLGTNFGLLVSSNSGSTFALQAHSGLPANQSIISFAGGKTGSTVNFVAVTYNTADVYAGLPGYDNTGGGQVVTMTFNANAAWMTQTIPAGTRPFFAGMARGDASTMYVAGGSDAGTPTVIKPVNGIWADILHTANNANVATGWSGSGGNRDWTYGELAMGFTVDSADANRLIITDYGFAHASTDGGATWNALYVAPADRNTAGTSIPSAKTYHDSGLDNTTAWQVAWLNNSNMFIANSDVRGQLSTDGGQTFGYGYTGTTANSTYRMVKTPNGNLYAGTGSRHDLYQSTTLQDSTIDAATGGIILSTNNGVTWTTIKNFGDVVSWVATDPTNSNRLFASVVNSTTGGIYVTNNLSSGAGAVWTKLPNPPRTEGHPFNIVVLNDGNLVVSYSGRRNPSGLFTASSGVFLYNATTQTWSDRSAAGLTFWTNDVVIDPADATQNTWYAGVYSGWGNDADGQGRSRNYGGLYKTTDRGLTWNRVLTLDRVTSCTFNTFDSHELFVTTETQGLWYSSNINTQSPIFSQVTSYPFRQPERVFFNPTNANEIWVTSFGAGVMVGTNNPLPPTTAINDGAAQRSRITSLTVTLPTAVDAASLTAAGAVTLTKTTGTAVVVRTGATGANGRITIAPLSGMVTSVTLTFDNANGDAITAGVEYGSLSDGRWQLAIPSLNYTSALNDPNLRRIFGDANLDGTVNGSDLVLFGNAFGSNNPVFDYNADGTVNGSDLVVFGNHFGITL
ncbi:hypothetical protein BH11PLA2_BH11PLA2_25390 [soil metagenome]